MSSRRRRCRVTAKFHYRPQTLLNLFVVEIAAAAKFNNNDYSDDDIIFKAVSQPALLAVWYEGGAAPCNHSYFRRIDEHDQQNVK